MNILSDVLGSHPPGSGCLVTLKGGRNCQKQSFFHKEPLIIDLLIHRIIVQHQINLSREEFLLNLGGICLHKIQLNLRKTFLELLDNRREYKRDKEIRSSDREPPCPQFIEIAT